VLVDGTGIHPHKPIEGFTFTNFMEILNMIAEYAIQVFIAVFLQQDHYQSAGCYKTE